MSFNAIIHKIYDHLYANAPVKTPAGIAYEFGKVAHTILYTEETGSNSKKNNKPIKIKPKASNLDLVSTQQVSDFRKFYGKMRRSWHLYSSDEEILLSDFDLAYCLDLLSGFTLSDPQQDRFGDIFEIIRSKFAKEKGGQFFTDPLITHLAMDLLEFDPLNGDNLIDLCAGSGGFLLAGMQRFEQNLIHENKNLNAEIAKKFKTTFKGYEIDPDAAETAQTTIQARIGIKKLSVIEVADSLNFTQSSKNLYSCAATNPPFGTKITIKDPSILKKYEISKLASKKSNSKSKGATTPQPPDVLFLERNVKSIKPGSGRLAIVLPYQILSGPMAKPVREWLIKNCAIRAVIDLPADTFQPHTGTKASLVIAIRRKRPLDKLSDAKKDNPSFFSVPKHIGHDRRGNYIYQVSPEGTTTSELLTDIPEVSRCYKQFARGKDIPDSKLAIAIKASEFIDSEGIQINASYYFNRNKLASAIKNTNAIVYAPLSELTERIFCPGRFKRKYVQKSKTSVPFLGGANITDFYLNTSKYISLQDKNIDALQVKSGWILVTRSGSTGIVSSVPKAWDGYAISEHVIRIIPDSKKVSPEYLQAILQSQYGQTALQMGVFGSVIDEITPEFIGQIKIPIIKNKNLMSEITKMFKESSQNRNRAMKLHDSASIALEKVLND